MSPTEVTSHGWRVTREQETTQIDAPPGWPGLVRSLAITNTYFDEIVSVVVDVCRLPPAGFRMLTANPHRLTDLVIEYLQHRGLLR